MEEGLYIFGFFWEEEMGRSIGAAARDYSEPLEFGKGQINGFSFQS